jgi:hypothetical protein
LLYFVCTENAIRRQNKRTDCEFVAATDATEGKWEQGGIIQTIHWSGSSTWHLFVQIYF